jgi:type IV secretion system protein VirD4
VAAPSDRWLVALAGVVVIAELAWCAGELAGWLATGTWPRTSPSGAPAIVVGLVAHPGRPWAGWPLAYRGLAAGEFYLVMIAVLAVSTGLAWLVAAAWGRWAGDAPASRTRSRSTAWARSRELRLLTIRSSQPGRVTLGRAAGGGTSVGRRYLAAEPRQSVIVVGPTQTQKTTGFAVPALLEWAGPVLATSVKTDLVQDTISWRNRIGETWVYDPASSTGLPASSWSPLEASTSWLGARRMAEGLCAAGRAHQGTGLTDGDFWYATAAKLLAPLLFAAARTGRGMSEVVRWVDEQDVGEVAALLEAIGDPDPLQAAWATWRRDERQRSSVYTTAETVLDAFADPTVSVDGAGAEVDPDRLLDGGHHTLYVCAPAHEQQRLRPVFAALVTQVLTTAFDLVATRRRPIDPPLLVVLDEAANVAPLAELDVLAATAAGHGIQLVTVWQDMAQISTRYGERAATVVNNHRAKVVLSGISDPATLDHLSHLVGEEEVLQVSTTTSAEGSVSTTRSTSPRRLAPADSLRRIRPGHGVLVYGHLPPARLVLRPWFADRRLARRARPPETPAAPEVTDPTQPPMKLSLARRRRLSALRSTITTLCQVPNAGRPPRTGSTIEGLTRRGSR